MQVILVRYGEIVLKGLNRPAFESCLINNIKQTLKSLGSVRVTKSQCRIYVEPQCECYEFEEAILRLTKVFGIVSVSLSTKIECDWNKLKNLSVELINEYKKKRCFLTFKVNARRGNKLFEQNSLEINKEIGATILSHIDGIKVDVNKPDITLFIEVREHIYAYIEIVPAQGGMPTGTGGRALLLLSGGIDSPVAGWMMAKRGITLDAIHFYSYPHTSERAKDKVISLAKILSTYCRNINLYIVPFTDVQLSINQKCPSSQGTIIMRRYMMYISEKLANEIGALALITGESLGQVASQTMEALTVTDASVSMPVFRPLIGMDKNEVVTIAREIDTFETSILPYQDCCTVFVPRHPETRPSLTRILNSETCLDKEELIKSAIKGIEILRIRS